MGYGATILDKNIYKHYLKKLGEEEFKKLFRLLENYNVGAFPWIVDHLNSYHILDIGNSIKEHEDKYYSKDRGWLFGKVSPIKKLGDRYNISKDNEIILMKILKWESIDRIETDSYIVYYDDNYLDDEEYYEKWEKKEEDYENY